MSSSYLENTNSILKFINPAINILSIAFYEPVPGGVDKFPQSMTVSNVSDEDLVNLSFLTYGLDGGYATISDFTVYTSDAPDTSIMTLPFTSQLFLLANTAAYLAGEKSFKPFVTAQIAETVDFITRHNPGLGRTELKRKIYSFIVNHQLIQPQT